jgi:hypothetical protein
MRTIRVVKINHHLKNKEDINCLQDALMDRGFYASPEQCVELWELYSQTFESGWLYIKGLSRQEIYEAVKPFFQAGPEGSVDTRYL